MIDSIVLLEKDEGEIKRYINVSSLVLADYDEENMNRKCTMSLMVGMASMSLGILETFAAGIVSRQPPLVYEYNLKSPSTIESEVIETTGTIKSISAFWNSEGEVKAEVSADAGVAYTSIINGQLLTEGFIPGNQLRFKIKIGEGSFLSNFIFGYEDSSGVSRHYQNNDLSKFKYRKVLQITGGNEELFNYPVRIKIGKDVKCEGYVEADFRDIRFTAADGQTPLAYYIEIRHSEESRQRRDDEESKKRDSSPSARNDNSNVIANPTHSLRSVQAQEGEAISADVWVKIPQIPKEGVTIYMYFGNKDALNLSNAENVFLFYDDFSADKLDDKKWQLRPEFEKRLGINNGYLGLKGCSVISRGFKMQKGVLEFKAKAEPEAAIQAIAKGFINKQLGVTSEQMVYSSAYPGAEHTIAINDVAKLNIGNPIEPMKDYIYKVILNSEGISFERYSENYKKQAQIQFMDVGNFDEGYIGLKADAAPFNPGSVYFEWIRVRPYLEVEPKALRN